MPRKPSNRPVLPAVENLRMLFKRAHDELNLKTPAISAQIQKDLDVVWPARELYRFVSGETRDTRRPMQEITQMTDYLKNMLGEYRPHAPLQIHLSEGQQKLVACGVLDMDAIAQVVYREIERQVLALVKPDAPKGP